LIKAIISITRPVNVAIAMASVYLGGVISFDKYYDNALLLAAISAGLIAGFGNIANDIFDIEIDRRNKSFRPLPSARITVKGAIILAMALAAAGLILGSAINRQCLLLASAVIVGLLFYTPTFKGNGYWGNLLISLISALAFFYGASAVGHIMGGLIPAAFAFLFHLGREIIKDLEDCEADKAENVLTGAVKYGYKVSSILAIIVILILIAATFAPYISKIYGVGYLIAVLIGTDISLVYIIGRLLLSPKQHTYRFIAGLMKALMPLGILAVFIGSRGY
jgi:geranylgeranylglycerol-phosphate geranylgeranyltransferase